MKEGIIKHLRVLNLVLCDNLEGWGGLGVGGRLHVESCWHMAETNILV